MCGAAVHGLIQTIPRFACRFRGMPPKYATRGRLTLWGDTQYDAKRCYEIGWVQRVVPHELLQETALEYARRMLYLAPTAVRNMKQALYRGYYMEPLVGSQYGQALEQKTRLAAR